MKAFLTGSHVYGTPKPESDIDLVVLVSPADLALIMAAHNASDRNDTDYSGAVTASLKFGKLNLLLETREDRFAIWRLGTSELKTKAPVHRDVAVETFRALRKRFGGASADSETRRDEVAGIIAPSRPPIDLAF